MHMSRPGYLDLEHSDGVQQAFGRRDEVCGIVGQLFDARGLFNGGACWWVGKGCGEVYQT